MNMQEVQAKLVEETFAARTEQDFEVISWRLEALAKIVESMPPVLVLGTPLETPEWKNPDEPF